MDQKERQIIVTIIGSVLVIGSYVAFVYFKQIAGNPEILNDFKFWGRSFLYLIPVAISALIVIQILYAIVNKIITREDISTQDDERDKLIELKASRVSHWVFTLGFIVAMGLLAFGIQPYVMFIILFASGFGASIISELVKLYYYRRGI